MGMPLSSFGGSSAKAIKLEDGLKLVMLLYRTYHGR